MPAPKRTLATSARSDYTAISEQGLAELLTRFIDDTEAMLDQETEAVLMLKKGYKKRGYQVSLKYRGEWSNVSRETLLTALFDYLKGEFD